MIADANDKSHESNDRPVKNILKLPPKLKKAVLETVAFELLKKIGRFFGKCMLKIGNFSVSNYNLL